MAEARFENPNDNSQYDNEDDDDEIYRNYNHLSCNHTNHINQFNHVNHSNHVNDNEFYYHHLHHHAELPCCRELYSATMILENSDLWYKFFSVGTEMVVTKYGRRMFPALKLRISGLKEKDLYSVLIDMVPVDGYRYRYNNSRWSVGGKADCQPPYRTGVYQHPDSPATGRHWMSEIVSFYKLKLTNNALHPVCPIILNSMQRYQPRVHLIREGGGDQLNRSPQHNCHVTHNSCNVTQNNSHVTQNSCHVTQHSCHVTWVFPETSFMTVTAYQNERVTQLKIEHNPFARGFTRRQETD